MRDEIDFFHKILGETSGKQLDKKATLFFCIYLLSTLAAYLLLKFLPKDAVERLFQLSQKLSLLDYLQLDYPYFMRSQNPQNSQRVWLNEFAVLTVTVLLFCMAFIESVKLVIADRQIMQRIKNESLMSSGYLASIFLLICVLYMNVSGFSENIILGHSRVSFGANDFAIFWFTAVQLALVGASWGISFFCFAVWAKLFGRDIKR